MKRLVVFVLTASLTLTACGETEDTEYTAETRDRFLAACTDVEADSLLATQLCVCVFDLAQTRLSFREFKKLEGRVKNDLTGEDMPLSLAQIVADCVISEAEL